MQNFNNCTKKNNCINLWFFAKKRHQVNLLLGNSSPRHPNTPNQVLLRFPAVPKKNTTPTTPFPPPDEQKPSHHRRKKNPSDWKIPSKASILVNFFFASSRGTPKGFCHGDFSQVQSGGVKTGPVRGRFFDTPETPKPWV